MSPRGPRGKRRVLAHSSQDTGTAVFSSGHGGVSAAHQMAESCERAFVGSLMFGILAASLTALRSHWGGAAMGRGGPRQAERAQGTGTPRKARTPSGLAEKQQQKHPPGPGAPPPSPPQGPEGAAVPAAALHSTPTRTQLPPRGPPAPAGFVFNITLSVHDSQPQVIKCDSPPHCPACPGGAGRHLDRPLDSWRRYKEPFRGRGARSGLQLKIVLFPLFS